MVQDADGHVHDLKTLLSDERIRIFVSTAGLHVMPST